MKVASHLIHQLFCHLNLRSVWCAITYDRSKHLKHLNWYNRSRKVENCKKMGVGGKANDLSPDTCHLSLKVEKGWILSMNHHIGPHICYKWCNIALLVRNTTGQLSLSSWLTSWSLVHGHLNSGYTFTIHKIQWHIQSYHFDTSFNSESVMKDK